MRPFPEEKNYGKNNSEEQAIKIEIKATLKFPVSH